MPKNAISGPLPHREFLGIYYLVIYDLLFIQVSKAQLSGVQELLPFGQSKISSDSYTKVWSGVLFALLIENLFW